MPTDDKPPQPPEKPTTQLEKVPAWAIALTERVTSGFNTVRADLSLVANDLDVLKGRVGNLETARATDEARANANSIKVKAVSDNDLSQQSTIADVLVWRAKVDTSLESLRSTQDEQLTLLKRLDAVAANPMVRRVAYAIGSLVVAYAAAKGIRLIP